MAFDPKAFIAAAGPGATLPAPAGFNPKAFIAAAGGAQPEAPADEEDQPSMLESAGRGALSGLTLGFDDEIGGALKAAFTDKTYAQARDELRAKKKAAQQANPWTYGLSEILGGAATPGLGAVGAAKEGVTAARTAITAAKAGAAAGALGGLGNSEADLTKGDVGGALKDTASGAAAGAATGALLHKILGGYIDKSVERRAQHLTEDIGEGAVPTVKRRLGSVTKFNEDTEQSLAVNVLDSDPEFLKSLKTGQGAARKVAQARLDSLGKEVTPIYQQLDRETGGIPLGRVVKRMDAAVSEADVPGNANVRGALEETRDDFLNSYRRRMDLAPGADLDQVMVPTQDVRQWVTRLKKQATNSMGSLSETERKVVKDEVHKAGDAILRDHLNDVAKGVPELAPTVEALRDANRKIAVYAAAEDALGKATERKAWAPKSFIKSLSESGLPVAAGAIGAGADIATGGLAYGGAKLALAGGKKLNREATRALAGLVNASRRGSISAAQRLEALRMGVPLATVYAVSSRAVGAGDEQQPAEGE